VVSLEGVGNRRTPPGNAGGRRPGEEDEAQRRLAALVRQTCSGNRRPRTTAGPSGELVRASTTAGPSGRARTPAVRPPPPGGDPAGAAPLLGDTGNQASRPNRRSPRHRRRQGDRRMSRLARSSSWRRRSARPAAPGALDEHQPRASNNAARARAGATTTEPGAAAARRARGAIRRQRAIPPMSPGAGRKPRVARRAGLRPSGCQSTPAAEGGPRRRPGRPDLRTHELARLDG
jgi:hypothetical protein